MTRLLIVRHGNSTANAEGIFAGALDVELTALGQLQASKTAAYIIENYKVDAVYASDLRRAFDTAHAVADRLGLAVHTCQGLREIFAGQWEGKTFNELDKRPSYHIWKTDIGNAVCDGGESVAQLWDRVVQTVTRIARDNEGKTVVIATHATPVRVLQCHCQGLPLSCMKDIAWVSNASVSEFAYDSGSLRIREMGWDKHLEGVKTALPANC